MRITAYLTDGSSFTSEYMTEEEVLLITQDIAQSGIKNLNQIFIRTSSKTLHCLNGEHVLDICINEVE